MEEPSKARMGRPKTDAVTHKKARAVSMTDAEYEHLNANAKAANMGMSEYVISRCAQPPSRT